MQSDLSHLPERQQQELRTVTTILLDEFEKAVAGGTQPWRRKAKVLKVVLFGSYARNDWVDEPDNGYQSDFDLLIVVNNKHLTDISDYWYVAEEKILHNPAVGRTINIIIHTLDDVNQALSRGEYFWLDAINDGILLFELPGHPLALPTPKTATHAYEVARQYLCDQGPAIDRHLKLVKVAIAEASDDPNWRRNGAFILHQAVETAYACFLLVRTLYFPRSHNIKFLRSLAEDKDKRLVAAWPREQKVDRRRFELLKRAYVDARYSSQFEISADDIEALMASATRLRDIVVEVCQEHLAGLRAQIDDGEPPLG
jgi:uncharacterized protein